MESNAQKYGYEDERFENAVSQDFHCSICLNVLNEPKMCRGNEHVFCSACITRHLANSHTCPQCMEKLTVGTLHRAPRVYHNYLSGLTINCDYFSRGCREFIRLGDLQTHVTNCAFAPITCSNFDCGMVINKRDKIHHETEVCDYRRVKCHDCADIKKEIQGIKDRLNQLQEMKDQLNQIPEMRDQLDQLPEIRDQLDQLPEMKDQLGQLPEMRDQLNQLPEMKDQLTQLSEMRDQLDQLPEMRNQLNQLLEMKHQLPEMRDQLNQLLEMRDQLNQLPEMRDQLNQLPKMRDQLSGMKDQLNQLPALKDQLAGMKVQLDELSSLKEDMKETRAVMGEVLHKLSNAEHGIPIPLHANATKQDILIAGGFSTAGTNSSVETFSWTKGAWTPLPPMKEDRASASSFVYENQIFVAGGNKSGSGETDSMEILKNGERPLKWTESPAKLPFTYQDHKAVVYQNSLIHIGGYNATEHEHSDAISEVLLTSPYSNKLLCRMPQPRSCHGVEIIKDNILILGGTTSSSTKDSLASVLVYDVNKKECKQMPSLPRPVWAMATVSWGDKVVVIGGIDKNDKALSDVLMYDSKTGENNVLPSMQRKRYGCSAVITGNVIVVMGGGNEKDGNLRSVECFTLGSNSWFELPRLIEPRNWATAVVMPPTF